MKTIRSMTLPWAGVALLGLVVSLPSCRKAKSRMLDGSAGGITGAPAVVVPELGTNGIQSLPGRVYQSQAASPIHWQPWSKETLERARMSRRLLFCVIAMPQQPGFIQTLATLAKDSSLVDTINSNYVPVLIDGDASREIGLLTADLCSEIRRPLNLPLFMWMTHEGNPVAWIPVPASDTANVNLLFQQSHSMVLPMWQESWEYVLKNSAIDNENRCKRFETRRISRVTSQQPAVDAVRCLRQLCSLYDPLSRNFDETGGLFPASSLQLLSMASHHPALPADLRRTCMRTTRELLNDLLPSAMFDPLDGGVFLYRRGNSWALPAFTRDCSGQARVAEALIEAHRATGDKRALELALAAIAFAEKNYGTPDGLFATGFQPIASPEKWMWSVEDVKRILPPEDAGWWVKHTGMKGLGNLPSEADPRRDFFRCNSLGFAKSVSEIAAAEGIAEDAFRARYQSAVAKMKAARDSRLGGVPADTTAHSAATLRMVSAYAAAFGITGDDSYRTKAVALLKKFREVMVSGPEIRVFAQPLEPSIGAGRAFLYGLALQAALDVGAITSDEQWFIWSEDLATTAAEKFASKGFLKECPDEANIIDLPVTDLVMLFDDSTAGMISSAEFRLAVLGRPLVESFSELATPMPMYMLDRPVLHTDLLMATLGRHYPVTVLCGRELGKDLTRSVERLAPRHVMRRPAKPEDQVPAGSVKVLVGEKTALVSSPAELERMLSAPATIPAP